MVIIVPHSIILVESDSNLLCECDGQSYVWHEFCDVTCDAGECGACSRHGKLMQLKAREEEEKKVHLAEMLVR